VPTVQAYLDTNLPSAIVNEDLPSVLFSLGIMFAHYRMGDTELVTSETMKSELEKIDPQNRAPYLSIYQSLVQVPYAAPSRRGQTHFVHGGLGGMVQGGIVDEPDFARLRQILGLGAKHLPDAEHIFEPINAKIPYFITADRRSILNHQATVEAAFPAIKLRDPVEFVTEMGW
jgi:hypothetical protein